MRRLARALALPLLVPLLASLVLAGCGAGGPSPSGSPEATVRAAITLVEAKQFDRLEALACGRRKAEVRSRFDLVPIAAAVPPELATQQALDALTVDFSTVDLRQTFELFGNATVHLQGALQVSVDQAKARQLIEQVARARGTPVSATVAAAAASAFAAKVQQRQTIDATIPVQVVAGAWLICW